MANGILPSARAIARRMGQWTALSLLTGGLTGSASALFLWILDHVTRTRVHAAPIGGLPWLIWLLPFAGMGTAWVYQRLGKNADTGNRLIIEEIHRPGGGVPVRMGPLVLFGTWIAHLCGASVGREGTAVQLGGSLAAGLQRLLRSTWLPDDGGRTLLMMGVAGGFGGVFGTPMAGALFALEVLHHGSFFRHSPRRLHALVPCLVAAVVADRVGHAWGTTHTDYRRLFHDHVDFGWLLLAKTALAGIVFGLASALFVHLCHTMKVGFSRATPIPWLRPAIGGILIVALTLGIGTQDYLGLGVASDDPRAVTLCASFVMGGVITFAFAWKMLFTAISVGSGFKGGEVTPLFFIGASLGNTLAQWLNAPTPLYAALGLVAVFAGAANTPLACTVMAMELFGPSAGPYFLLTCFLAYFFSGKKGIYSLGESLDCKPESEAA